MEGALTSLVIKLGMDASGVKKGVADADKSISGLGGVVKSGVSALALGASGMFAIATKGAVELENAQAKYQAATGASAEEARKAGEAINKMGGRNLQSVAQIGDVLSKTVTDLGLTGDAANKTAEQFLKFGTATGQDASEAVKGFDDILDAYGKTAADIPGIMDQLVASHQRYGGSIAENEAALGAMAPQLAALNLSMDDGIGILNLYAASGLDAASAQKSLNSAITNLPPGTDLRTFMKHLQSIEDPAKRAAEAVKVFGQRGGAGLANALKPGSKAFDDYVLSADEVAGATTKAGDAIEGTLGNKARLALKGFGAAVTDVLGKGGPMLSGLAALGTLAGSLGLGKLVDKLVPMMKDAGKEAGGALIDGLGVVTGAAGTIVGNLTGNLIQAVTTSWSNVSAWIMRGATGSVIRAAGAASGAMYAAAAGVAEKLGAAIASVWSKVPFLPGVVSAITGAGGTAGALFAGAFATGGLVLLAAYGYEIMAWANDLGDKINKAIFGNANLDGTVFDSFSDGLHGAADAATQFGIATGPNGQLIVGLGDLQAKVAGTTPVLDAMAGAVAGAAAAAGTAATTTAEGARSVSGSWAETATSVGSSGASLNAALTALGATAAAALDSAIWYERGKNLTGSLGKGMQDGATVVLGAFDTLRTLLKDGFSPATLAKELREHGKKYMDTFVEGMHSKVIGAKQAAEDAGLAAITALSQAGFGGVNGSKNLRQIGQYYDELLAGGLTSSQVDVALKAAGVSDAAITAIHKKYPRFGEAGLASGDKLGGGLTSSVPDVRVAANDLANAAMGPLGVVWQNKFTTFGDHAAGNLIGAFGGHLVAARRVSLSIAKGLSSHLAFSEPPPGPLNSVREWLPHMIDNLVKGGQAHIGKLAAVGNDMASALAPALSPSPMGGSMGLSLDRTFRIEVSLRDVQPGVDERALGQGIGDVIGTLTGALRREFRT